MVKLSAVIAVPAHAKPSSNYFFFGSSTLGRVNITSAPEWTSWMSTEKKLRSKKKADTTNEEVFLAILTLAQTLLIVLLYLCRKNVSSQRQVCRSCRLQPSDSEAAIGHGTIDVPVQEVPSDSPGNSGSPLVCTHVTSINLCSGDEVL